MAINMFSRYKLLGELGKGSMGVVYRAIDRLNGHNVALKYVSVADVQFNFDNSIALNNEFQLLATLQHPHVVRVLDYGFDNGRNPYFTMNLLEKTQTILEVAEKQSLEAKIRFIIQMLQALDYIHRRGIIHRDLKPTNVLVQDDAVFVLDFGLASIRGKGDSDQLVGTIAYMAPEVLIGNPASVASDLYAVGLIAYQMIIGQYPFDMSDPMHLINYIIETQITFDDLDVDPALAGVLVRLLSKSPDDRYPTANALLVALCDAVGRRPPNETMEVRESYLQAAQFIGRKEERAQLEVALEKIANNDMLGSAWLIGGESGVGKSRLIREMRSLALTQGKFVLYGQCVTESGLPYNFWRDILRYLAILTTISDAEASILRYVVPDIDALLGRTIPDLPQLDQATLQARLQLIAIQMLIQVLDETPVVLIVEDLQWIRSDSQSLLKTIVQMVSKSPLMIMGTYRNDEAPQLANDYQDVHEINLNRLTEEEIIELSMSMLGDVADNRHIQDILYKETEGNVFFLVEVVRMLAQDAGRLGDVGLVTLPEQLLSGGIQKVINYRLLQVPIWAHPLLDVAAVAGRHIDQKLMTTIVKHHSRLLPENSLNEWLSACANASVFDVQDEHWRFSHDKIREGIIAQVSNLPELHELVAEGIELTYPDDLDAYARILTYHWRTAGNIEKEMHYIYQGALRANDANDYHDAIRLYQRAFDLKIYEHAANPDKVLADLKQSMATTLRAVGDYKESMQLHEEALALYETLGDPFCIAEALFGIGDIHYLQGRFDVAKGFIEKSYEIQKDLDVLLFSSQKLMSLGIISARLGDSVQAKNHFETVVEVMKKLDEPVVLTKAMNNLAIIYGTLGDYEQEMREHQKALAIRRQINDRVGMVSSLINLGGVYRDLDKLEDSLSATTEGLKIAEKIGAKRAIASAHSTLGQIKLQQGEYAEALRYQELSVALRQQLGDSWAISVCMHEIGKIHAAVDDYEHALSYYKKALSLVWDGKMKNFALGYLFDIAQVEYTMKNHAQALTLCIIVENEFARTVHGMLEKVKQQRAEWEAILPAEVVIKSTEKATSSSLEEIIGGYLVSIDEDYDK